MNNLMNKLSFNKKKENTKSVVFKVDPTTSQNLVALRNMYSKETNRRVTTGEILKNLLINTLKMFSKTFQTYT